MTLEALMILLLYFAGLGAILCPMAWLADRLEGYRGPERRRNPIDR